MDNHQQASSDEGDLTTPLLNEINLQEANEQEVHLPILNPLIFNQDYTEILKNLMHISSPIIIANLISYFKDFVRSIILARNGNILTSALVYPFQRTFINSGIASLIILQRLFNEKALLQKDMGGVLLQGSIYSMMISIPFCAILLTTGNILRLSGYSQEQTEPVDAYFYGYTATLPATLLLTVQANFYISKSSPWIYVPLNLIDTSLDLFYLYLFLKYTSMEVTGVGLAQTARAFTTLLLSTLFLYFNTRYNKYNLFKPNFKNTLSVLSDLFKHGLPILLESGAELTVSVVVSIFIGRTANGTASLSAYHIGNEYMTWLLMPAVGLSVAVTKSVAKQDNILSYLKMLSTHYFAMLISSVLTLITLPVAFLYQEKLCSLFIDVNSSDNNSTLNAAYVLLPMVIAIATPTGWRKISCASLWGLKETLLPSIIAITCVYGIGVALSGAMFTLNYDASYIVGMQLLGTSAAALSVFCLWLYRANNTIKLYSNQSHSELSNEIENGILVQATERIDNQTYSNTYLSAPLNNLTLWRDDTAKVPQSNNVSHTAAQNI